MLRKINRVIWCDRGWMPYHYGFCPNEIAWDREMKRLDIKELVPYPAEHDGRCTPFENSNDHNACALVTVRPAAKSALQQVSMLVHEATHVWQFMRAAIGEKEPSIEFEAYSIQNISENLIKAYEMARGPLLSKRRSS